MGSEMCIRDRDIISFNNLAVDQQDNINALKAIKTKKEIENIKLSHIYDGAALTKFIFWLKKNLRRSFQKCLQLIL